MMKFTSFNKVNVKEARKIIQNKLDDLKDSHGLVIRLGNIQFDSDSLKSNVSVKIEGGKSDFEKEFDLHHFRYGFKGDELNRSYKVGNKTYKFIGLIPRARKSVAALLCIEDGKNYRVNAATVIEMLKGTKMVGDMI